MAEPQGRFGAKCALREKPSNAMNNKCAIADANPYNSVHRTAFRTVSRRAFNLMTARFGSSLFGRPLNRHPGEPLADESAHYEFMCREAGVGVEYCAESFRNDGSLMSNIVKNLKRSMAGEYSRELSTKAFAGQCRLIKLGFKHGGSATYGLNRQLLDENGVPKGILSPGQRRSLQTDRVILTRAAPSAWGSSSAFSEGLRPEKPLLDPSKKNPQQIQRC